MISPLFSRGGARAIFAGALLLGSFTAGRAQSDTAETPGDSGASKGSSAWPAPFLPATNSASSSFLESHPALEQSLPPPGATLSLHSPANQESPEGAPSDNNFAPERAFLSQGSPDELPAHLLVVYNSNDPDSKSLADYYATRRAIPDERVLGIACPLTEQINRDQYEKTVREPIISYIYRKNWMTRRSVSVRVGGRMLDLLVASQNDVWAIVLMRGVPLKIANDPTLSGSMEDFPALKTNAAAVDSELALLPVFGLPAGGFAPNIFFDRAGSGLVRAGPELATKLVLVTRLDGPRPADVRRMIDDTLYAEQNRLAGLAVLDSRGLTDAKNEYTIGDLWLRRSREMLRKAGWMVQYDEDPAPLPPTDPLNHVAIYLGWYHDGACGPWITPPNRLVRGAIAYHLHSFSAATVRSATSGWVGPLITHGAAVTMGCVYEPYLDLTPHLDVFTQRLMDGDSFAEAAYACQRTLSWMVTVVGDPLYRPFKKSIDSVMADSGPPSADHYDWLLLQRVQRGMLAGDIPNNINSLVHYLDVPGAVAQEGLGDLLGKLVDPEAVAARSRAYKEAAALDVQPVDRIRVGLKLAALDRDQGREDDAQTEMNTLRDLYPLDAERFGVAPVLTATGTQQTSLTPQTTTTRPDDMLHPPTAPKPPKVTNPVPTEAP